MITEYAKVRIVSQKILNLFDVKYNRTYNESLTVRDFCFIYDRFQQMDHKSEEDQQHRTSFLEFARGKAIEGEAMIDERIAAIKSEYDAADKPYVAYGASMFEQTPNNKPTIFAAYPHILDVIWSWRVIFRVMTVINKCQYFTILCERARVEQIISRNKLSNEYRRFYVAPVQTILYETQNWIAEHGDVPGYQYEDMAG